MLTELKIKTIVCTVTTSHTTTTEDRFPDKYFNFYAYIKISVMNYCFRKDNVVKILYMNANFNLYTFTFFQNVYWKPLAIIRINRDPYAHN